MHRCILNLIFYISQWLDYDPTQVEPHPISVREAPFLGMFGYGGMPSMAPPPDWYYPPMPMYEGQGPYPPNREYHHPPPFRGDAPEHVMMMMGDAPPDARGGRYPTMGPYSYPPEMLEQQYNPRIGRASPPSTNASGNASQNRNFRAATGRPQGEPPMYYNGSGGQMSGPYPGHHHGMTTAPTSNWNGGLPTESFWPAGRYPPHFGGYSGHPMEGSGMKDDGSGDDQDIHDGKPMHL